jgi:sulfite exporter TauE/SafE/copper chaperone CopZ
LNMPRIIIYEITGMTCVSCERRIDSILKKIPGTIETEVSLKKQRAAIRLADDATEPDICALNNELRECGYTIFPKGQRPAACEIPHAKGPLIVRLKRALIAIGLIGFIALIASPLRQSFPAITATASLGAMFALGLLASASSCLASTGGFLLAYTSSKPSRLKLLAVHFGRLFAFMIGGAALGAIGGSLPQGSTAWYGGLALVLGIAFIVVGLNLLDLSPSLAKFGLRLPSSLQRLADRTVRSENPATPFLVGAVTFILPCGFTQTAQGLALASGSAQQGLLLLTMFALGTLPILLGVTWFGSSATVKHRYFRLATGSVLFLFALGQIEGGLTLLGFPYTPSTIVASIASRSKSVNAEVPTANAAEQVVQMTVNDYGYQPNNLTIKKGVPVRWEIDGQSVGGCVSSIVVPTYRISQALHSGLNVIRFTPTTSGRIPFSCGMGMVRGSFTVTE